MQIRVDTHTHSYASGHSYSTIREMSEAAVAIGLQALAVTEHAPSFPDAYGRMNFDAMNILPREMNGVQFCLVWN